jgi:hypothetical protein
MTSSGFILLTALLPSQHGTEEKQQAFIDFLTVLLKGG